MYKNLLAIIGTAALLSVAACNNAKSPDAVANDVAKAEQKAAGTVSDAQNDAAKNDANAAAKVDDKSKDLNNVQVQGAYDVAMAKADGDRKVALVRCNTLSGNAQSKCKDQVDADYEAAKANAKAAEISSKQ